MSRARPGRREAMATGQATDEFASRRRDRSTVTHLSRVEQFVKDDAADTEPGSGLADGCSQLLGARAMPPRSNLTAREPRDAGARGVRRAPASRGSRAVRFDLGGIARAPSNWLHPSARPLPGSVSAASSFTKCSV